MENTIECRVVMLPIKEAVSLSDLLLMKSAGGKLIIDKAHSCAMFKIWQAQHLYFISDEEIKSDQSNISEGDWKYGEAIGNYPACIQKHVHDSVIVGFSKVICCTDPSLNLPAIPEAFKRKYVAAQGSIKTVRLEQVRATRYSSEDGKDLYWKLKLTSDNEVIVLDKSDSILKSILRDVNKQSERRKLEAYSIKEEKEKEAIEFTEWIRLHCIWEHCGIWRCHVDNKVYNTKQLYELWKSNM